MTATSRKRRKSNAPRPELARTGQDSGHREEARPASLAPPSPWQWFTFPVYFALSLGLFIGVFMGIAAYDHENTSLVIFLGTASMLGWGFSRFVVRWMTTHTWVKPRPRKRKA